MKIHTKRCGTVFTLFAAALVASGCGESVADAESALCADLAALNANIATMQDLDTNASLAQFKQARQNVKDAWNEAEASAENVNAKNFDEVEDAWEEFADDIKDVDDKEDMQEALANISSARDDIAAAQAKLQKGLDCSTKESA